MSNDRKIDAKLQSILLSLANGSGVEVDTRREERDQKIELLRDGHRRIQSTDPAKFRAGDLVRWQPHMKHCKWPQYGESVVVVECLDPPLLDEEPESGLPYFRMPLTLVLGMHHKDGFHCWHFDGRRFELATSELDPIFAGLRAQ